MQLSTLVSLTLVALHSASASMMGPLCTGNQQMINGNCLPHGGCLNGMQLGAGGVCLPNGGCSGNQQLNLSMQSPKCQPFGGCKQGQMRNRLTGNCMPNAGCVPPAQLNPASGACEVNGGCAGVNVMRNPETGDCETNGGCVAGLVFDYMSGNCTTHSSPTPVPVDDCAAKKNATIGVAVSHAVPGAVAGASDDNGLFDGRNAGPDYGITSDVSGVSASALTAGLQTAIFAVGAMLLV